MYDPKILLCRTGEAVRIRSSDPTTHNVHIMASKNREVNRVVGNGQYFDYTPQAHEIIDVMCDIHPWMRAKLVVQEHPYYAITDENGVAELTDIPSGSFHHVMVWHPVLGELDAPIVIESHKTAELNLEYPEKK